MLSRREKLLIRPWQQRRYNHHRRKVQCALPAIDVGPPLTRSHVCCKLKRQQSEQERRTKIEQDNCRLLQRMGTIMRTNRLDNHWVNPPPNFLQRVGIYYLPAECDSSNQQVSPPVPPANEASNRNRHCLACNPQKIKPTEVRMVKNQNRICRMGWEGYVQHNREKKCFLAAQTSGMQRSKYQDAGVTTPRRITLTQGELQLAVSYPANTMIRLKDGQLDRLLQREYCECKARSANRETIKLQ
ncbi:hypothetical protein Cfor_00958 [Coptotermes formosanus]|uniref:Uncharacterized protein n=1 Tax=Coptotermes formosanus TaxID=36987 RepID=A0A6L2Q9F1_COPFO|nr:hypothetical protein Cfor_00958 [Coptotermes formosanus]